MVDHEQPVAEAETTTVGSETPDVDGSVLVEDDVAIEDVSIDGMCGVY